MVRTKDGIKVDTTQKRVRAYAGGDLVFDTTNALLVWEIPHYPTYYIPENDVLAGLVASGDTEESERGTGEVLDLKLSSSTVERAALRYPDSPIERIRGYIRFQWDALDEWLEEDEPVYTHARDPYKRIDILASSRHVEIVIDGVKVADSTKPTILFETGLPPRYYLPIGDVRFDLMRPSKKRTWCPYKGKAGYFSIEVNGKLHEDVVWIYRTPLPESQKITGLVCFYNEKVDLYVDGKLESRPKTKFS
ncbi:MAG TPA: DUF427 domain-containing protein [Actinomycetota bacterium]